MPQLDEHQVREFLNQYLQQNKGDMDPTERQDAAGLTDDTAQGYEALQYLLGNKKKEVSTFYDEHPVQAVGQDLVNSAAGLGLGAIAAKGGHSALKDILLNYKMDKARKSFNTKDGLKPYTSKDYSDRPDLAEIFPEQQAVHVPLPDPQVDNSPQEKQRYNQEKHKADFEQAREQAAATEETNRPRAALGETHQVLNKVKGSYPRLNKIDDPRIARLLARHLPSNFNVNQPGNREALDRMTGSIFEKERVKAAPDIATDTLKRKEQLNTPLKAFGHNLPVSEGKARNFAEHFVTPDVLEGKNWHTQGKVNWKGIGQMASHNKVMAGAGAAIGGGLALSPVVNFLQRTIYGDKKTQEWMKAKRETEGRFE